MLGLTLFEDDRDAIESAADQRMAHVRTFQLSQYAEASQQILNELAAARVCLLSQEKKAAYDSELHAILSASQPFKGGDGRASTRTEASPETQRSLAAAVKHNDESESDQSSHAPKLPVAPANTAAVAVTAASLAPREKIVPAPFLPITVAVPFAIVKPAPQEPSVATERWLASERSKTAFYHLLNRSIWAIAVLIPACLVGYAALNTHHAERQPVVPLSDPPPVHAIDRPAEQSRVKADAAFAASQPAPSRAAPPTVTTAQPPSVAHDLYALNRVWFLGWANGSWNDIHDQFEARQDPEGLMTGSGISDPARERDTRIDKQKSNNGRRVWHTAFRPESPENGESTQTSFHSLCTHSMNWPRRKPRPMKPPTSALAKHRRPQRPLESIGEKSSLILALAP